MIWSLKMPLLLLRSIHTSARASQLLLQQALRCALHPGRMGLVLTPPSVSLVYCLSLKIQSRHGLLCEKPFPPHFAIPCRAGHAFLCIPWPLSQHLSYGLETVLSVCDSAVVSLRAGQDLFLFTEFLGPTLHPGK